jgi:hypothetical protein
MNLELFLACRAGWAYTFANTTHEASVINMTNKPFAACLACVKKISPWNINRTAMPPLPAALMTFGGFYFVVDIYE